MGLDQLRKWKITRRQLLKLIGSTSFGSAFPYMGIAAQITESRIAKNDRPHTIFSPHRNYSYHYKGQIHCHSNRSVDAPEASPETLVQRYRDAGYEFVAISDHTYPVRAPDIYGDPLVPGVVYVPSEENSGSAHLLIVGMPPDTIGPNHNELLQNRITEATSRGTITVIAHPFARENINASGPQILPKLRDYTGIEVFNANVQIVEQNPGDNSTLNYWLKHNRDSAQRIIWGFATDDYHGGDPNIPGIIFDRGYIVVNSGSPSPTSADILTNIGSGNFTFTQKWTSGIAPVFKRIEILHDSGKRVLSVQADHHSAISFLMCDGKAVTELFPNAGAQVIDDSFQGWIVIKLHGTPDSQNYSYSQPIFVQKDELLSPNRRALLRLEDIGPGGSYRSPENLRKLREVGTFLQSQGIPFHVALIPSFVEPLAGYEKSITDSSDAVIVDFLETIKYLRQCGASVGLHGFTHQYGISDSGIGFEFGSPSDLNEPRPPDDADDASSTREKFEASYTSSRIIKDLEAVRKSGIQVDWFETPHYTATLNQRRILEGWAGLFFEERTLGSKTWELSPPDHYFSNGSVFVPTPLGYIAGDDVNANVTAMLDKLEQYLPNDLASFYFHPFLEFKSITFDAGGRVNYDENSPLKQLVRGFKDSSFRFVSILSLSHFIPSARQANLFPAGPEYKMFFGDIDGDHYSELIVWHVPTGTWYVGDIELNDMPFRYRPDFTMNRALDRWAVSDQWQAFVGDFNGDGKDDILVWYPEKGQWQVALSDGTQFHPSFGRGDGIWLENWAVGEQWQAFVGDFNGDGKDDILVWYPEKGQWQVAFSDGKQFHPAIGPGNYIWLDGWAVGNIWKPMIGDFDGDGKDDIVVWNQPAGEWQVALSNGTWFVPNEGRGDSVWLDNWAASENWQALVGDFDGDGKSDILVVDVAKGDWQVALSFGTQFIPLGESFRPWVPSPDTQPLVGVFTRDGRTSLCARNQHNGTIDFAISVIGK